jgi:methionyl-tRNA formyltransferase
MSKSLRLIFAGTPEFAAHHLKSIIELTEHEVVAVYTQPDRPAGRGKKLKPSAVKQVALDHNIPVYQPHNFKQTEDLEQLQQLNADLMVVVAYGLLLPKTILASPKLGCINVHASLLPRWRGAAPIQRAIAAGDTETGVVIMQMDEGLDTGNMLLTTRCEISPDETGGSLHDKLAAIGLPALNQSLDLIADHATSAIVQDESKSCYAAKISKQELAIDWRQSAAEIERNIRAFNPFPTAYASLNKQRIKIWQAHIIEHSNAANNTTDNEAGKITHADKKSIHVACGEGCLSIQQLQLPGGKALDTASVMNSKADLFTVGTRFDVINTP